MIEVLKQALEALESCGEGHITDGGNQWHDAKLVDTAITSLRQAIAELESQEPLPEGCVVVAREVLNELGIDNAVIDTIARPTPPAQRTEQEPVAIDWERIAKVQNAKLMAMCDEVGGFEKLCEVMNKYKATHPPQRTEQEPAAFAGIEMWIGNARIKRLMTQTELHYAIDPWAIVKFYSDSCIDALKEKNT